MQILHFTFDNTILQNNLEDYSTIIYENLTALENDTVNTLMQGIDKKVFFEPSLSTYLLAQDEPNLNAIIQVLWCYSDKRDKVGEISIQSDNNGIIHVHNVGYFSGSPNALYKLKTESGAILFGDEEINDTKEEFVFINGLNVKLAKHIPPFLNDVVPTAFINNTYDRANIKLTAIENALNLIKQLCFDLYEAIGLCTKELFLYDNLQSNSFATIYSYGTGFINMEAKEQNEVFFIDDIAHQCGHIVYYAITLKTNLYLKIRRNTPMSAITGVVNDERELYDAFHALFTYTTIIACLDNYCNSKEFDEELKLEALARIGFYMNKMRLDLAYLCSALILTKKGFEFLDCFKSGYNLIYEKYKKELEQFLYINQPYNFDMSVFKKENGLL